MMHINEETQDLDKESQFSDKNSESQGSFSPTSIQIDMMEKIEILEREGTHAIKKDFDCTKDQFYYNVGKLIKNDYVESLSDGSLQLVLTQKGKTFLDEKRKCRNLGEVPYQPILSRSHKITVSQPILARGSVPQGFVSKQSVNSNWKHPSYSLHMADMKVTVQITPSSVVYYFRERFGSDAYSTTQGCLNDVWVISKSFVDSGWDLDFPKTAVVDQHHAIYNEEIAKFTRKYNIFYKSARLTFDRSLESGEFELVHPSHASDDFSRLTSFFEAVIRGDIDVSVITKLCRNHKEVPIKNSSNHTKDVSENSDSEVEGSLGEISDSGIIPTREEDKNGNKK